MVVRHLAGASHIPTICMVVGVAYFTDLHAAWIILLHNFQAERATVFNRSEQSNFTALTPGNNWLHFQRCSSHANHGFLRFPADLGFYRQALLAAHRVLTWLNLTSIA